MTLSASFADLLQEHLAPLGHITFKRMFSGAGVYCDGVIFGLILRGTLNFKVDDSNRAAYEAEGMEPFSYEAQGKVREIAGYWRVPERLFDEPEEMVEWARAALAAGRRAMLVKTAAKARKQARAPVKKRAKKPGKRRSQT